MTCRLLGGLVAVTLALAVHAAPAAQTTPEALLEPGLAYFAQERFGEAYRAFAQAADASPPSAEVQAAAAWAALLSSQVVAARRHVAEARRLAASLDDEQRELAVGFAAAAETWMALSDGDVPRAFELWHEASATQRGLYGQPPAASLRRTIMVAVLPALKERLWNGLFDYTSTTPREDMLRLLAIPHDIRVYEQHRTRARDHFTRLLTRPDAAFDARMVLAELEPAQEEGHLQAALQIRPGDLHARIRIGDIQGSQGRAEDALATFRALEREHPDLPAVRWGLYRSLAATGDEEGALRYQPDWPDGTLRILPLSAPCLIDLHPVEPMWVPQPDRGRTMVEVRSCMYQTVWIDPMHGELWRWVGDAWFNVGEYRESVAAYDRAVRYAPDSLHYQVSRAVSRYHAGEQAAAKVDAERLSRIPTVAAFARYWLGRMLLAENDAAGALPHLRLAAEREPRQWAAHHHLGIALVGVERTDEAVRHFERAVELSRGNAEVLGALAVVYDALERTSDRDRTLAELWEISPDMAQVTDAILRRRTGAPPAARVPPATLGNGWTYAAASATTEFWAQTGRIRPSAPYVQVWTAATPVAGEEHAFRAVYTEVDARQRGMLDRVLARHEVDCEGFRARAHENVYYDAAGQVLHDDRGLGASAWEHPVPGSVLESVVEHVCAAAR